MKVYAIRQISTGKFLPEVRGCYTQSIPMPAGEMMPRLFLKRASAKQALQYWLGGVYKAAYSYGDFEGGRDWEGFDITPDPMRSPSDMEVVEFNLEESCPNSSREIVTVISLSEEQRSALATGGNMSISIRLPEVARST